MKNQIQNPAVRRTLHLILVSTVVSLCAFPHLACAQDAPGERRIYLDKNGQPFTKDSTLKILNENLEKRMDTQGRYFFVYKPSEKKEVDVASLEPQERESKAIAEMKFSVDPAPNTKFKTSHGQLESIVDESGKFFYRFQATAIDPNKVSSATAMTAKEKLQAEMQEQLQMQRAFLESQNVQMDIQYGSTLEKKYYFNGLVFYKFKNMPAIGRELTTYEIDQLSNHDRNDYYRQPAAATQKVSKRETVRK